MKRLAGIILLLLISVVAVAQEPKAIAVKPEIAKPARTVILTPEQNRLLADIEKEVKGLEERAASLMTRKQGIIDTIAVTNKLNCAQLNEPKPGEFDLQEIPCPPVETPAKVPPKEVQK